MMKLDDRIKMIADEMHCKQMQWLKKNCVVGGQDTCLLEESPGKTLSLVVWIDQEKFQSLLKNEIEKWLCEGSYDNGYSFDGSLVEWLTLHSSDNYAIAFTWMLRGKIVYSECDPEIQYRIHDNKLESRYFPSAGAIRKVEAWKPLRHPITGEMQMRTDWRVWEVDKYCQQSIFNNNWRIIYE